MVNSGGEREAGKWSNMGPHDEFLELCAVSTSGDLTEEEQNKLKAHLVNCPECRQALKEFEGAVDIGMPLLASELTVVPTQESGSVQPSHAVLHAQESTSHGVTEPRPKRDPARAPEEKRGFAFAQRNGHARTQLNWNYVWMPFAACVLLSIALWIYAYRSADPAKS
jgi:hypothetical protein